MKLGFHTSIEGSVDKAVDRAVELECTTFQLFTRNPRTWKTRDLTDAEVDAFRTKLRESGISPVYAHMPYIPNLASPDPVVYGKSKESLKDEVRRCGLLGIPYLVTHLGSHLGSGEEAGRSRVLEAIAEVAVEGKPTILLENGSGSGHHVGNRLPELASMLEASSAGLGVCLDTCHAHASGYDLRSEAGFREVTEEIKRTVGFSRIRLVHLNDSVGGLGSHVDHHEHIGLGKIGMPGFRLILRSRLAETPMIMETPIDERRSDAQNMARAKRLAGVSPAAPASTGTPRSRR